MTLLYGVSGCYHRGMEHKSFGQLKKELQAEKDEIVVGGTYAHYKTPTSRYRVTGLAVLKADNEIAVKYASIKEPSVEFVRSLKLWNEKVEWEGKTMARFKLVER